MSIEGIGTRFFFQFLYNLILFSKFSYLSQLKATERLFLFEKIAQGRRNSNEWWNRRKSLDNPATSLKLDYLIPTLLRVMLDFYAVLLIKETSLEKTQVITRLLEKASHQLVEILAHDQNCHSSFFQKLNQDWIGFIIFFVSHGL